MASGSEDHCLQYKVSLKKTVSVYPKSPPSQAHLLPLSNLDRKCPTLMHLVLFYRPSHRLQNLSDESLFSSLKKGLEQALCSWYPAAGRLMLNHGRLDLLCGNSGAVLVEAATKVKISELGDLSHYNKFYEDLVYKPPFNGNCCDMPLVVAQVTRFGCGGYSVGVGTSHSLFDGIAAFDFLTAWASLAAEKEGIGLAEPVHDRGRLLVERIRNQKIRVVAFDHLHQLIEQAASSPSLAAGGCKFSEIASATLQDYVLRTFHLNSEMIENLKRKVVRGKSLQACSSFDVVAAHLWKARTRALGLEKGRKVCLQFSVDTRAKLVPPLPKLFTGNAYVLASVSSTVGEVAEETLESIVEKINEAKGLITNSYVKAYLEALEAPQRDLPPLKELTIVSDWTRMPFHSADFGHGSAAAAAPLAPPLPQVAYFMQSPSAGVGAIDVRIGLLPSDELAFSHYFLAHL